MNGLRVTKIVKEIKFEGVWGELKAKKLFPETIIHKIFETNSSFHVNYALREKFNFCFSRDFCYYQQNFHFDRKNGH